MTHKMIDLEGQIFGKTTYDPLFKRVLNEEHLRSSFFKAFLPGLHVESSQRLDDHMNPLQELQNLRGFLQDPNSKAAVDFLRQNPDVCESVSPEVGFLLKGFGEHFDDFQKAFPRPKYNGAMDFACRLDNGEYALIEMQVYPENTFDTRALAYIAAFYGGQLFQGEKMKNMQRVVGINILAGYLDHWKCSHEFMRHYRFQNQLGNQKTPRYLEGMELIQYSIANAPKNMKNRDLKDWVTFYRQAHLMNDKDVKTKIKTKEVLEAFEMTRISNLPQDVRESYASLAEQFAIYSDYTDRLVEEAREKATEKALAQMNVKLQESMERERQEAKIKAQEREHQFIVGMIIKGVPDEAICEIARISKDELDTLKQSVH